MWSATSLCMISGGGLGGTIFRFLFFSCVAGKPCFIPVWETPSTALPFLWENTSFNTCVSKAAAPPSLHLTPFFRERAGGAGGHKFPTSSKRFILSENSVSIFLVRISENSSVTCPIRGVGIKWNSSVHISWRFDPKNRADSRCAN